ncbi:ABC transporter substrate-binding protein [Asticcacaulis solisilvae]|uniref:ABC transporter substrate-binding protein n=1 Tax=Asticcacaulis solisilvae TaxID=1217274 RepID=UPI003FD7EECF
MSSRTSRRSLLTALGAAAVGISFAGLEGCSKADGSKSAGPEEAKLNFYNWDTYIGETTLDDFKKATGIAVNMTLFASNDELFAKLKAGNPGYDVIVPTNDYVPRMIEANMLMPLDHSKIPNFKNVNADFQNPVYDPGRKYSMPYTWLVIGLGYRKSKMKGVVPDSWKYVFDSDMFKKRLTVLGDSADMVRLAAKYLGYSLNNIPDDGLAKIEALLTKQTKAGNILKFAGDEGDQMLADKEADLVVEYNGDIAQRMLVDKDIGFVIPKEGSELSSDTLAIPVGAPRPDNAHKFINFILDGQNGAEIAKTIQYATPNDAARALMPDTYKNNPIVFPTPAELSKCEYAQFPGVERAQKYEEIATRVKAAASGA